MQLVIGIVAKQFFNAVFKQKFIYFLLVLFFVLVAFAAYTGYGNYKQHNSTSSQYQQQVRSNWENNPNKHPHRMAHYGSFVFRLKHPLSFFEFGTESYTGNMVYLEAHKQNTSNFSQAATSNGLLRFGELSMAMLWQLLLPLILCFIGYGCMAIQKENGTLKIMISQGATMHQLILGNWIGLFSVALVFIIPILITIFGVGIYTSNRLITYQQFCSNAIITCITYLLFTAIVCGIIVLISATAKQSKLALIKLLACWLIFAMVLPRGLQALGNAAFPSPSKVAFNTKVEEDIIKQGDSHNPNDKHYSKFKDSILQKYNVDSVHKLPFNFSGAVMKEGEKISAEIYANHLQQLQQLYKKQNAIQYYSATINPFAAIKQTSMNISGTSINDYEFFLQQSEAYRYQMAQAMNNLQIEHISNKKLADTAKPYVISNEYWKQFKNFGYKYLPLSNQFHNSLLPFGSLLCWFLLLVFTARFVGYKVKPI